MTLGVGQCCSPGIQPMACHKDSMGLGGKVRQECIHQNLHGLAVAYNGDVDAGRMGVDPFQSLLHFPSFQGDVTDLSMGSRQHRGGDGMAVKDCACACFSNNGQVQGSFGADAAVAFDLSLIHI